MYNEKSSLNLPAELSEYIGEEEISYIEETLQRVNKDYEETDSAIGLAYETVPAIGIAGHILNQLIYIKFKDSDRPRDIIAVAVALAREGAYYRKTAIEYFERYFDNECETMFDDWTLHSTLAILYENEYEFDKAISQLKLCIVSSNGENPADFTRIGDILIKIDVNKAKEYYDSLIKSAHYEKHKYTLDFAYENLKEKIAKGYVYKPRKSKKPLELSEQQRLVAEAAEYYI